MPILSMIMMVSSGISILCMIAFMIQAYKRENVEFNIRSGTVCRSCKEDIEIIDYYDLLDKPFKTVICKSCKRNEALESVLNSWKPNLSYVYRNWKYIFLMLSLLSICFSVSGASGSYPIFGLIGSLLLLVSQISNFFLYRRISRPIRKS